MITAPVTLTYGSTGVSQGLTRFLSHKVSARPLIPETEAPRHAPHPTFFRHPGPSWFGGRFTTDSQLLVGFGGDSSKLFRRVEEAYNQASSGPESTTNGARERSLS
jgi:hypothetical protein